MNFKNKKILISIFSVFFITFSYAQSIIKQGSVSIMSFEKNVEAINSVSGRYSILYAVDYQVPAVALAYLDREECGGIEFERPKINFALSETQKDLMSFIKIKHSSYTKSGYDRGHLISNDMFNFNESLQKETFAIYNICPQLPSLNRGINGYTAWREIENVTEKMLANADGRVYVITGPILDETPNRYKTIGNCCVVPKKFFKILLIEDTKNEESFGFVKMEIYEFPNENINWSKSDALTDVAITEKDIKDLLIIVRQRYNLSIKFD